MNGTIWRLNFSRVEWEVNQKGSGYEKKKDPATGKPLPENNWVWSPQGVINMHFPERWGYVQFSDEKKTHPGNIKLSAVEVEARNYLRLIYYKQVDYRKANKYYAKNLGEIGLSEKIILSDNQFAEIIINNSADSYTATLSHPQGRWEIVADSGIRKIK